MIRTNIDAFESDYMKQRNKHPNPEESYPLNVTPANWFVQLDMWFRMQESLDELKEPEPVYAETQMDEEGSIEFVLEEFNDS